MNQNQNDWLTMQIQTQKYVNRMISSEDYRAAAIPQSHIAKCQAQRAFVNQLMSSN